MVEEMFATLMLFGILLMAGFAVREVCPPFQKLLIPSSLIGGLIGLILGPQVLGAIEIPAAFEDIPHVGLIILSAAIPIGVGVSGKRIYQHLDYTFCSMTSFGFQAAFGLLLGAILCKIWPELPEGWGLMGVGAYFDSHGTIPIFSSVIDPDGVKGALSMGMVLATFGILFAIIVGMAVANYGVRKGWAIHTKNLSQQPKHFYRGPIPEDEREPIGMCTINPTNINSLAFHLGVLAINYKFGELLFQQVLARIAPIFGRLHPMLYALIGGLILWPFIKKAKLDRYIDKNVVQQITAFTLEMVILGAMATLQLDVISKFFIPLLLHTLICCGLTGLFIFSWMKWIGHPEWFEKALMAFGLCTGSNAQGYALVRAVDPKNQTSCYEALGVYNALFFWNMMVMVFMADIVLVNKVPIYLIGLALMSTTLIGTILFRLEKKKSKSD